MSSRQEEDDLVAEILAGVRVVIRDALLRRNVRKKPVVPIVHSGFLCHYPRTFQYSALIQNVLDLVEQLNEGLLPDDKKIRTKVVGTKLIFYKS
jgi:hypothetical protein